MKIRTALFELGSWYGLGLTPAADQSGQRVMFRWLCLGFFKVEVWRGTLIERLQQRLPSVNLREENDILLEEIAERDELIRRQAFTIDQLEMILDNFLPKQKSGVSNG